MSAEDVAWVSKPSRRPGVRRWIGIDSEGMRWERILDTRGSAHPTWSVTPQGYAHEEWDPVNDDIEPHGSSMDLDFEALRQSLHPLEEV